MFGYLPQTNAYLKHAYRELKGFDWEGDVRMHAREALKKIIEDSLEQEVDLEIGVVSYKRSPIRKNYRNGYYVRQLLTEMGNIEIRVPRLRDGSMEFQGIEKYKRRSKTIDKAILGCFVMGHSTRKVSKALLPILGEEFSSSTVSRIAKGLDEAVREYHQRPLKDKYVYLYLDGVILKQQYGGTNRRRAFLCAYGITDEGRCEMIDYYQSAGESQQAWEAFLNDLYRRGLKGEELQLIITDGGKGLLAALEVIYPRISRQHCWAHKSRNILNKVKSKDQEKVKRAIQKIWHAKHLKEATNAYWSLAKNYRAQYPSAVRCLEKDIDNLLEFYRIPHKKLWPRLRTTNPIERCFREVKRRTRPMEVFTNKDSMERILYAVFHYLNDAWKNNALKLFTHN